MCISADYKMCEGAKESNTSMTVYSSPAPPIMTQPRRLVSQGAGQAYLQVEGWRKGGRWLRDRPQDSLSRVITICHDTMQGHDEDADDAQLCQMNVSSQLMRGMRDTELYCILIIEKIRKK